MITYNDIEFCEEFGLSKKVKRAVSNLRIPHLIIHGENDEVVKPEEAKNLHTWNANSKLVFIEEMNHPLGCIQPWTKNELPPHLSEVIQESVNFILKKND